MFYLMTLKYAIFSNIKVTKIERSAFFGTPGIYPSRIYINMAFTKMTADRNVIVGNWLVLVVIIVEIAKGRACNNYLFTHNFHPYV